MKTNNNNNSAVPSHIESEDMVSYLDGELDRDIQTQITTHLESCWDCRGRLSSVERSIENFLQLRQTQLLPPELPPSDGALELFRQRLTAHRVLAPSHSLFKLRIPDLRVLSRRISGALNLANYSLKTQVFMARATAAILLISIVTGFILLSGRFNTVSASELLRLSIDAQAEQMSGTDQPVLHQRIQLKQKNAKAITWEIWNDTVNSRVKLAAYNEDSQPAAVTDVRKALQANRMNEHRPLSAASYKAWTNSLASKTEEVTRSTNSDGTDVLTIKTNPVEPVAVGGIVEARFAVRANDYHPTELYVKAKMDDGEREFELIEQDFAVLSLKDVDPAIFADPTKVEIASTVGALPKTVPSAGAEPPAAAGAESEPPAVAGGVPLAATTEAEVDVLDLLNKVGADISEQLNVTRTADGRLLVEGLVETGKRKGEILKALSSVANNPAIRVKIQTIEEATRALARQKQQSQPDTVDRVEVNKGSLPVDSDLRAYFANKGGDTDEQIQRFASRVINHSQAALFQASALNRLANRFTGEQLKTLEPAARAKWLNILKGYASAVRRNTANLRGELQPVFGGLSDGGDSESVTSDADLISSAKRLYELAAANDRIVRSAFTLSSGNASVSAIKTQQFRRSLGSAESLASAIERAR